jgi:hypothetical protein
MSSLPSQIRRTELALASLDGASLAPYASPMVSVRHRRIHRTGWVAWLLLSGTVHLWAVLIAKRIPESGSGVVSTALLPVVSWFRLAWTLPDEFSLMRNAFTTSLMAWVGCGLLLIAVRRLNRTLQRADRMG